MLEWEAASNKLFPLTGFDIYIVVQDYIIAVQTDNIPGTPPIYNGFFVSVDDDPALPSPCCTSKSSTLNSKVFFAFVAAIV